jgi:hypothetical protein
MRGRTAGLLSCAFALLTLVIAAQPAASAEPNTKKAAVAAFERYVDMVNRRQWGRLYTHLYPGQKAQISSGAFAACLDELRPNGVTVEIDDVLETYTEKVTIPGTADNV